MGVSGLKYTSDTDIVFNVNVGYVKMFKNFYFTYFLKITIQTRRRTGKGSLQERTHE